MMTVGSQDSRVDYGGTGAAYPWDEEQGVSPPLSEGTYSALRRWDSALAQTSGKSGP